MKNLKSYKAALGLLSAILFLSSCASKVPYLPKAEEAHQFLYGYHITLELKESKREMSGELIAVDQGDILILPLSGEIPKPKVERIPLTQAQSFNVRLINYRTVPISSVVLMPLVLSHGIMAAATLPINVVTSGIVIGSMRDRASVSDKEIPWAQLPRYARFPQGLPPGLDLAQIQAPSIKSPVPTSPANSQKSEEPRW